MNKILLTIFFLYFSIEAVAKQTPTIKKFEASNIIKVIVRAGSITDGTRITPSYSSIVKISGTPYGGAEGYHSPDKNWKETKAKDWGMSFEAKKFGSTLVISSKSEIAYIHHHYWLANIELEVPQGIQVILSPRELTGDGNPDLSEPNSSTDSQRQPSSSASDLSSQ